jgi:hypothetical protein
MIQGGTAPGRVAVLLALAVTVACNSDSADPGANLVVNPGEVTLEVGQTQQFTVSGAPGPVTWTSTNSSIASVVAQTGFVTAVSRGQVQITAVIGTSFASARVDVTERPAIQLSKNQVTFNGAIGQADPVPDVVTIGNAGGGTLANLGVGTTYGAGQPTGWLSAQLAATTAPTQLTLRAAAAALPPGNYTATVSVSSPAASNSPLTIAVTFIVTGTIGNPQIGLSATNLGFTGFVGAANPPTIQMVRVSNAGTGTLDGLIAAETYPAGSPAWIDASWQGRPTVAPVDLAIRPRLTLQLAAGTYQGTVHLSSTIPGVAPRSIDVTYVVYSFSADIKPLFFNGGNALSGTACSSCHAALGAGTAAAQTHAFLTANLGALLCKITGGAACQTGINMRMTPAAIALIQAWIDAGTPSN